MFVELESLGCGSNARDHFGGSDLGPTRRGNKVTDQTVRSASLAEDVMNPAC